MRHRLYSFMLIAFFVLALPTFAQNDDTPAVCPENSAFWLESEWPVESLMLGSQFYNRAELDAILTADATGDVSLQLAQQLIIVKLNIAAGADPTVISAILIDADGFLASFAGKLPYNVAEAADITALASTFQVFNNGLLSADCDEDNDDDPEATPEPEITAMPEVTPEPEITPEVTDDGEVLPVIIVIEGPVTAIQITEVIIITIYDIDIIVQDSNPLITAIQIGDVIRVEGELADDNDLIFVGDGLNITIVIININIVFIDIDVFISDDDEVWRDGNCNNPPPSWAPANGWRRNCEDRDDDDNDDDDD